MSYEIKGKAVNVGTTESFGSNGFTKRALVIETGEQYPQKVELEFVKDKTNLLDSIQVGDELTVSFNVRGREWINPQGEAKYFNTLQGWKLTNAGSENDKPPF